MACISVCIAAYNADAYINECLLSIARQTLQPYEVVIVDDGSKIPLEISTEIRGLFQTQCIRLIRTKNCGPYAARRFAIEYATGDIVVCVDSDDELAESRSLEKMMQGFDAGADVVIYNATTSRTNVSNALDFKILGSGGFVDKSTVVHELICGETLNSLWCKAFRKTCYLNCFGKDVPRLLVSEDRLQSFEIVAAAQSFFLVDEPLYFYRPNPCSIIHSAYDSDYYHQACYVEGQLLRKMAMDETLISAWAAFFLRYISACILRYSRDYSDCPFDKKAMFFDSVMNEDVTRKALQYLDNAKIPSRDSFRLVLLALHKYRLLDISMMPWRLWDRIRSCSVVSQVCDHLDVR